MSIVKSFFLLFLLTMLGAVSLHAQEAVDTTKKEPLGPPHELREIRFLVGNWTIALDYRKDPAAAEWSKTNAGATCYNVAGGAAVQMDFTARMERMPYLFTALYSFDRQTGKWQMAWVDNSASRISLYSGEIKERVLILQGEDYYGGKKVLRRVSMNLKDHSAFDWTMEQSSDNGNSWVEIMKARFKKR
jgi:hypothetical protein